MDWFLVPPLSFLFILAVVSVLYIWAKKLAPRGEDSAGKAEPYACGENVETGRVQPNYGQFFPFAFFFTIMHVAALVLGTVPGNAVGLALPFLAIAGLAILILFRKD